MIIRAIDILEEIEDKDLTDDEVVEAEFKDLEKQFKQDQE